MVNTIKDFYENLSENIDELPTICQDLIGIVCFALIIIFSPLIILIGIGLVVYVILKTLKQMRNEK